MTASVLATELAVPMFTIRLDSLLSKFMGETASKLRLARFRRATPRGVPLMSSMHSALTGQATMSVRHVES